MKDTIHSHLSRFVACWSELQITAMTLETM